MILNFTAFLNTTTGTLVLTGGPLSLSNASLPSGPSGPSGPSVPIGSCVPPGPTVPSDPIGTPGPTEKCGPWIPATFTSHDFAERAYVEFGSVPANHAKENRVSAVHSKDFEKFKYHTLEIKKGSDDSTVFKTKVFDGCFDFDCLPGCCTRNMKSKGTDFLIDLYTGLAKEMYGTTEILEKGWYRDCGSFGKPSSL